MKRSVVVMTLIAARAFAGPPTEQDVKGVWWDEWNRDSFQFNEDGSASRTNCASQSLSAGKFGLKDGNLTFTPGTTTASTWTAILREGRLILKSDSEIRYYRRETREEREHRLLEMGWEMIALQPTHSATMSEIEEGALGTRKKELNSALQGLSFSLFGSDRTAQEEGLMKLAEKRDPELFKVLQADRKSGAEIDCANHLRQIGIYFALFESKFKKYPEKLDEIKRKDMATDMKLFDCPVTGAKSAYVYIPPAKGDETAADAVMAYEEKAHPDGNHEVLTFIGSVYALSEADLQISLKQGVKSCLPHVEVKSCKLISGPKGKEIVVTGTVTGLRARPGDEKRAIGATLKFSLYAASGKKSADPVRVVGIEGGADPDFEGHLVLGDDTLEKGYPLFIETTDTVTNRHFAQSADVERER